MQPCSSSAVKMRSAQKVASVGRVGGDFPVRKWLGCLRTAVALILLDQIGRFHFEDGCEGGKHIDGRTIFASLQGADIGPIDVRQVRKLLLRQAFGMPIFSKVQRKIVTNIHIRSHARCCAFIYGVYSSKRKLAARLNATFHSIDGMRSFSTKAEFAGRSWECELQFRNKRMDLSLGNTEPYLPDRGLALALSQICS